MRAVIALSFLALAACGSSNTPPPQTRPTETVRISGGAAGNAALGIVSSTMSNVASFPVPLDRVWSALPAAYDSIAIPVADFDATTHLIGNSGLKIRRRLGKVALSKYLDCGQSQMGPNADEYEISLSVLSKVAPGESGTTTVTTTVEASGQGVQFAGQYVRCVSRGEIETRLVNALRARLR